VSKTFQEMKSAHALRLDLFTDSAPLHQLTKTLLEEYKSLLKDQNTGKKGIKGLDFYKTMKLVLENLIYAKLGMVSFSLRNDYYCELPKRYNPQLISAYKLRAIIQFLVNTDRVTLHKGVYSGSFKMRTRIEVLPKFKKELRSTKLKRLQLTINKKMERIILKDRSDENNKIYVDYRDDETTDSLRAFLFDYESFINQYKFSYQDGPLGRITFKRVFNNGKFNEGGRFYSEYQNIKSAIRSTTMLCDLSPLSEFDFKGMHINMLYSMIKSPYPKEDVYTIKGYEKYRNLFKIALQIALNAKSRGSAVLGMNKHLIDNKISLKEINGKMILEAFTLKHGPIAHFFFSGIGVQLQYLDSVICEGILKEAKENNIPVLPVHDSFLVRAQDRDFLIKLMQKHSKAILGEALLVEGK